ncbi:type IV pilus assembly PilZ [Syntrophobotulus glycolicus DSM 8271]|uniref:Type IV pilus assembly PilZ n=1 Tax=Syntrophobotulus glycolicus (strain DSM 8271 / FlGlyR) TaxID=645991 RepID=F0SZW5_SYNGF|nr:flagellar brake domain-containing protein [Syntrophobotulus glycolicus]ADY54976.1 type IV pilus assembly PilZ [Syntrophobotulus glycolicus DSM 8271]
MLYEEKIYEGLSIELFVDNGPYQGRYRTKIEEVGKAILSIGVPFSDGQYLPLREGTKLEIEFVDHISAYHFRSILLRRFLAPVPTLMIEYPKSINKIQRRKHVRIPVVSSITYQIIGKEGLSEENTGYLIDLSGGGLKFVSEEKLEMNDLLLAKIKTYHEELDLPVKVVRLIEEESKKYKISVEYQEISEKTRDKIIAYIFEVQRELRRKGLI